MTKERKKHEIYMEKQKRYNGSMEKYENERRS